MPVLNKIYQESFRPATVKKGKEIIVEFYAKNPFSGTLKRYRMRFNHIPGDRREKIQYAENVAADINIKLRDGWLPEMELEQKNNYVPLANAVEKFIDTRRREYSIDTVRMYTSFWNNFSLWAKNRYKKDLFVIQVNKTVASAFCQHLMTEREINFRTFNNYLTGLNAMFRWFVECGYHNENPFQHIKKKKTTIKRRMYLTDRERSILRDYLSVHKKEFLRIVLTSYYAILRRKEITMIRCGHVNLEKRLLFVPAENSKNKKDAYVSIPDALAKQLEELKPSSYPEDYYLFSDGTLKPGLKKIEPKWISDEWTKIRKELCFNNRIQFMSLRDTGIRQLLRDGVTIDDVMIHARHWSLEVTKTYLIHDTAECNWAIVKRAGEF